MFHARLAALLIFLFPSGAFAQAPPRELSPPERSPEAMRLAAYIHSLEGKGILAGQQSDYSRLGADAIWRRSSR